MLNTTRQAMHLIGREYRGRWVLLIIIAVIASAFEMVGAALVYVLISLVTDPGGEIEIPVVGDLRTQFAGMDETTVLVGFAIVMVVFFLLRAVVHIGKEYAQSRIAYNAGARLSETLAAGYLAMPYAFHLRRNSAGLIRNSYQAVNEVVTQVFVPMIRIAAEAILVLVMMLFLVLLAPVATGLAVLVIGGSAVLLTVVVQPRLKRIGTRAHALQRETLSILQQSLHGIRDIKVLGREQAFAREFGRGRKRLARTLYLRHTAGELPRDVMETALIGFILAFFVIAVVTTQGLEGSLSVLGLFAYAGLRLQPSLKEIIRGLNHLKFASAPIEDLDHDLRIVRGVRPADHDRAPLEFVREWRADGVEFRYEETTRPALRDINLSIAPGELIGICGPTGGGKTTLVDVLTGLLEPTKGQVTVDGLDLREHARRWHANLGIVPQMVFLTDDTLRRNIALGVPDADIDDQGVLDAVRQAQLGPFVSSLPDGLDTLVGERGVRVSGGQRQRIAIARALYHQPQVLVFDEGTSALDNTTEAQLMSDLERLRGDRTIVMVAHRLSTVRTCDRVVLVEAGRIAGIGTFDELRATNQAFQRLAATST